MTNTNNSNFSRYLLKALNKACVNKVGLNTVEAEWEIELMIQAIKAIRRGVGTVIVQTTAPACRYLYGIQEQSVLVQDAQGRDIYVSHKAWKSEYVLGREGIVVDKGGLIYVSEELAEKFGV